MLASACPGWICYAEKQLGSYILPYISSVKCPQQTMGATIKHHICKILQLRPDEVYHVTVMPCYDKKLEASRDDFVTELESHGGLRVAEVDSVLTSREILDLIQAIPLNLGGEENLLRFAMCYGFWDLQNIVRTIKLQKCKYHFVEVMACPSGCLNGGGQIKPKPRQTPKDLIQALETIYMENAYMMSGLRIPDQRKQKGSCIQSTILLLKASLLSCTTGDHTFWYTRQWNFSLIQGIDIGYYPHIPVYPLLIYVGFVQREIQFLIE
ncbi:protein NAR1-like isoform X2 [Tripterygium wilfordii]|uniref:protein NAR1-like isoform X2 n=1 Tax=Tripterygium wilfordii TaxID=458696 RepID=UPI0018F83709|nr:protein NAR1-like isoform X2 [Tripterygium wilfordii]